VLSTWKRAEPPKQVTADKTRTAATRTRIRFRRKGERLIKTTVIMVIRAAVMPLPTFYRGKIDSDLTSYPVEQVALKANSRARLQARLLRNPAVML
jgi:hypothetical protein